MLSDGYKRFTNYRVRSQKEADQFGQSKKGADHVFELEKAMPSTVISQQTERVECL